MLTPWGRHRIRSGGPPTTGVLGFTSSKCPAAGRRAEAGPGEAVLPLGSSAVAREARNDGQQERLQGSLGGCKQASIRPNVSGHYSNPPEALETVLGALRGPVSWRRGPAISPSLRRLGNGVVLRAVVDVMVIQARPMAVGEVHIAVECCLGHPVSPESVNSCLSTGARGSAPRFRRVARGRYMIASPA